MSQRIERIISEYRTHAVETEQFLLKSGSPKTIHDSDWIIMYRSSLPFHVETQSGGKFFAGSGDLVCLLSGEAHDLRSEVISSGKDNLHSVTAIRVPNRPHALAQTLPSLTIMRSHEVDDRTGLVSFLEYLLQSNHDRTGIEAAIRNRIADAIAIIVLEYLLNKNPERFASDVEAHFDEHIRKALVLINYHPEISWTLTRLANEIGLSRSSFARRFKQSTGETPMSYVAITRTKLAMTLLETNDYSVSQVAHIVGYKSDTAFQRAFKNQTGETPGNYRNKKR